jgi:hypothetical protein
MHRGGPEQVNRPGSQEETAMNATIEKPRETPTRDVVGRATFQLLAAAGAAAALALPSAPRLALLPLAVVFGWSQIGGV